jgi:tetratricopeptide (TPR) repeat protein
VNPPETCGESFLLRRRVQDFSRAALTACAVVAVALTSVAATSGGKKIPVDQLPMGPVPASSVKDWFRARFGLSWSELESRYTTAEVDRFLLRWRNTFPDDAEAWLSSANWNARKSAEEVMHMSAPQDGRSLTQEGAEGALTLNGANGHTTAFVTETTHYSPARIAEAKRLYEEGERKFPYRLDIYDSHARMLFITGEYSQEITVLGRMAEAVSNPALVFESSNYQKVGSHAKDLLLGSLHEESGRLSEIESGEAATARLDIALLTTRMLPQSAIAWNDLTAAYDRQGNVDAAFRTARKAYELAPTDEYVVMDLAQYCMDFGLTAEAIQHYRWIVKNGKEQRFIDTARAKLSTLKDSGVSR